MEQFLKSCCLWETHLQADFELHLVGGIPYWSRGKELKWWSSRDENLWTEYNPNSLFPCAIQEEERKECGCMKVIFNFLLVSHCSHLLLGNKLHWFPFAESSLPVMVTSEWSPCPYLSSQPLYFITFFALFCRGGEWECGVFELRL